MKLVKLILFFFVFYLIKRFMKHYAELRRFEFETLNKKNKTESDSISAEFKVVD